MDKTAYDVYGEWKQSLFKGFTTTDLNICSKGSIFYLGLKKTNDNSNEALMPLFCSRTIGFELFHLWYLYYLDLLNKAPQGSVPEFSCFYAVAPADMNGNWLADEFVMESVAGAKFVKSLGRREYTKISLPTLDQIKSLCNQFENVG